jgi:hypothetical protein
VSAAVAVDLSIPMRLKFWTVAQHKYGWSHVSRHKGEVQVADALVRRGLVEYVEPHNGRDSHIPEIAATDAGRAEIQRRWPASPFAHGTYEPQPNGWQKPDGSFPADQGEGEL